MGRSYSQSFDTFMFRRCRIKFTHRLHCDHLFWDRPLHEILLDWGPTSGDFDPCPRTFRTHMQMIHVQKWKDLGNSLSITPDTDSSYCHITLDQASARHIFRYIASVLKQLRARFPAMKQNNPRPTLLDVDHEEPEAAKVQLLSYLLSWDIMQQIFISASLSRLLRWRHKARYESKSDANQAGKVTSPSSNQC
jgi:hypothetical protein